MRGYLKNQGDGYWVFMEYYRMSQLSMPEFKQIPDSKELPVMALQKIVDMYTKSNYLQLSLDCLRAGDYKSVL